MIIKAKKISLLFGIIIVGAFLVLAVVPTTLEDFFMAGSQPGDSGNLEKPGRCSNCHGGYDADAEPTFNWSGSMMAQAARDPLFYACMAVSLQDVPESGDLCIRCHSPGGWLAGRSEPTDGSALNADDLEGVHCDFCHKLVNPATAAANPYATDPDYTMETYGRDSTYLSTLTDVPPAYANGMFVVDSDNGKRGPFTDADPNHQKFYSPFHKEAELCGTCHDVSNPAFTRVVVENGPDYYVPNAFDSMAADFSPFTMFPVERTFSEWKMSAYNSPGGVPSDVFGGNKANVATCQDCHMQDVTGYGCNKSGAPLRSDLPLHDMTGGNTFVPGLVAQLYPGDVDTAALNAGVDRAQYMLQHAATLQVIEFNGTNAVIKVTNETGHKLPSGYPEGRRMWLNVKGYKSNDQLAYESGGYDFDVAEIVTSASGDLVIDPDPKIYEIKPGISESLSGVVGIPSGPSFHFVLNNEIFSDNRIPPRGFTNAGFEMIQSPPVNYTYADGQHWDETIYDLPPGIERIEATLYYQTLSNEYVTYLRDENTTNDAGNILYSLWENNGKSAPEVMTTTSASYTPPCFTILLDAGWNITSLPYITDSAGADHIFSLLVDNESLVKVQNQYGDSYEDRGIYGGWQSNIGEVIISEGYKILMNSTDSIEICGPTVTYPYPIPFNPGWNIIGFPKANLVDAMEVVQQLIDSGTFIKAQNEQGRAIENLGMFGGWQNFIGSFAPGEGYKIKVATHDTLWIFDSYSKSTVLAPQMAELQHYVPDYEGHGVDHMNFNFVELAKTAIKPGDELAIFDGELCVGALTLLPEHIKDGLVSVPASAADKKGMPGFMDGNPYSLRWWSVEKQQEQEIKAELIKGDPVFTKHESAVLSLENMLASSSELSSKVNEIDCYPNPFTAEVNIALKLTQNAELDIQVFNQFGQTVRILMENQMMQKGKYNIKWNGENDSGDKLGTGIYYLRIKSNGEITNKKLVYSK